MAGVGLNAQSEITLPMFQNVFQSSYLIPTVKPEHTLSIGLPGLSSVYVQTIHNGFVPKSVFKNDTLYVSELVNELSDQNMLYTNADLDLFHLRIRVYNWNWWVGVRQRHSISLFYPKDLLKLSLQGNKPFVGSTMDFGGLGLNVNLYREYTFGLSTELNNWSFGGRISLLQGFSCLYFKPNKLQVYIDDTDYNHTVSSDGTLYSAGIPSDIINSIIDGLAPDWHPGEENEEEPEVQFPDFNVEWITDYLTRFRNPGTSLSFGASYTYEQRATISFSFSDVGFIYWSDSTRNYRIKGQSTFEGIDALGGFLTGNEISFDSTLNAFRNNFNDDDFEEPFITWLPPKFYLTLDYKLARRTNIGFQFYSVINRKFYPAYSIGITQGIGRSFSLALSGSFNQKTMTNLGFGLMVKSGPVQTFILADNYYTPLVDPLTFTNFNIRFGMNLVFGRVKTPQGLPYR